MVVPSMGSNFGSPSYLTVIVAVFRSTAAVCGTCASINASFAAGVWACQSMLADPTMVDGMDHPCIDLLIMPITIIIMGAGIILISTRVILILIEAIVFIITTKMVSDLPPARVMDKAMR